MADVQLQNSREHDIYLNGAMPAQDGGQPVVFTVVIPGATPVDDRGKVAPGIASIDSAQLDLLKDNPVVKSYFDEGWLKKVSAKVAAAPQIVTSTTAPPDAPAGPAPSDETAAKQAQPADLKDSTQKPQPVPTPAKK